MSLDFHEHRSDFLIGQILVLVQFTMDDDTQSSVEDATLITTTITVVLISTIVRNHLQRNHSFTCILKSFFSTLFAPPCRDHSLNLVLSHAGVWQFDPTIDSLVTPTSAQVKQQ